MMMAQVRSDLREQGLGVPVGDSFVCDGKLYQFRWLNEGTKHEQFQVKLSGMWYEAVSIDWDFVTEEKDDEESDV